MSIGFDRTAALAAVVGGVGTLGPALVLAAPTAGVVAGAVAGACWWLAAQALVGAAQVAWSAAGDRELGVTQCRHLAGIGIARQCQLRASASVRAAVAAVPAAALGALAAVLGAQARDGHLLLFGTAIPGFPLLVAAVLGPLVGAGLGTVAGLAAPTRRQLSLVALGAVVVTVSLVLLRPSTPSIASWAVAAPLGGPWPVTPGWSLDRYLVVDVGPVPRLASFGGWVAVVGVLAVVQLRRGAVRRSVPPIERP